MFQTRKNQLSRLEERIRQLHANKTNAQLIAELELIIPAEMAALMWLRKLRGKPFSERIAGMSGPSADPRGPLSQNELDRRYGDDHRRIAERLAELRELTGDDDAAWEARTNRLQAACERMVGTDPQHKSEGRRP